jgi:hypothetical protein
MVAIFVGTQTQVASYNIELDIEACVWIGQCSDKYYGSRESLRVVKVCPSISQTQCAMTAQWYRELARFVSSSGTLKIIQLFPHERTITVYYPY